MICVALSTVVVLSVIEVPPDDVKVTTGEPPDAKLDPANDNVVAPTAKFTDAAAVTVGMGRTVPTTTAAPLDTPYMVTTADSVCEANDDASAGTVAVSCVAELTLTLVGLIDEPPDVVSVTAGEPPAAKLVPVMMTLVAPTATFTLAADVTVGIGRMVPTAA